MDLPSAVAISAIVMAWRDIRISFSRRNFLPVNPAAIKRGIKYRSPTRKRGGSGKSSVITMEGVEEKNFQRLLYQVGVM
jgi:hypothetical protein